MNRYFRSFDDNISRDEAKTNSTDFGASISYFPYGNLPGVSLFYSNLTRKNELAENGVDPASTLLKLEDNKTQLIGLSSSYKFNTGSVINTATVGISSQKREDNAYPDLKSDFTLLNFGLRNQFEFPLTTRLSYSQTGTGFGADSSKSSTDIHKFFAEAQYSFEDSFLESDISPFVQINFQKIGNEIAYSTGSSDFNRMNYGAGFYFRNAKYGNLSLRYDYIDFGSEYNWKDTIISTRYDVSF
jgi:hypothetical protein